MSLQDSINEIREMARLHYILYRSYRGDITIAAINHSISHEYDESRMVDGIWYSSEKKAQSALVIYKLERMYSLNLEESALTLEIMRKYVASPQEDEDEE